MIHWVKVFFGKRLNRIESFGINLTNCIHIFRVPSDPTRRKKWITAIETHQEFDYSLSTFYVCDLHFPVECIIKRGARTDLAQNALPSIFTTETCNSQNDFGYEREEIVLNEHNDTDGMSQLLSIEL